MQKQPSWQSEKARKSNSIQVGKIISIEKQVCRLNKEDREQIHDQNLNKDR